MTYRYSIIVEFHLNHAYFSSIVKSSFPKTNFIVLKFSIFVHFEQIKICVGFDLHFSHSVSKDFLRRRGVEQCG